MDAMKHSCRWLALLALAWTAPAFAVQQPEQDQAAEPESREMLGFMAGRWRVDALDPGTGETFTICYTVAPFVGDAWLSGAGTSKRLGLDTKDVWGRDPRSGGVIRSIFDSSGVYAVVTSPGWRGNRLVLEGDAHSPKGHTRVRETIDRMGPDEFIATWEAHRDGAWSAYSVERATRLHRGSCDA